MATTPVEDYLMKLPRPIAGLGVTLSSLIHAELPDATVKLFHGIPVWSVGAQPTVGIKAGSKDIALMFFRGQRLIDPAKRLTASGSFEMATVKLVNPGDVEEDVIRDWLRQAAAIDQVETDVD